MAKGSTKKPKAPAPKASMNGAGEKIDFKALRENVEKNLTDQGAKKLPDAHYARLLGTSVQTLKSWSKGTSPRGNSVKKIRKLEADLAAGKKLDLPPKRGRQAVTKNGSTAAPKKAGRPGRKPGRKARGAQSAARGNAKPELLGVLRSMLVYAESSDDPRRGIRAALQFLDGESGDTGS